MKSSLTEVLALKIQPVAIQFTDTKPERAIQFREGRMGCVASMLYTVAKGRQAVFDRTTYGCPGGGTGLGFGNCYTGFPIEQLLSTGGKAKLSDGSVYDMGEGERFFDSPKAAAHWADSLPYREAPTEFIVCKPLDQVDEEESVSLVLMFVHPDQLAALVTLAGFRRGEINSTVSPWGAACQSVLFALEEAERDKPRGVIGFLDISQRHKVPKEFLTFTVPFGMYVEMEASVDESFLNTTIWQKLRDRW